VQGAADLENDNQVGFKVISTDDIDDIGIPAIIKHIRERIGDSPVYLRCVANGWGSCSWLTGSSWCP